MKTINKIAMVAAMAGTIGTANAQVPVGEECGCPSFGSRPLVNMSTLADANGNLLANTTLTCSNTYTLNSTVYVGSGLTLTVQAGTVVRGATGSGLSAKSLVISRGGKIIANGSENCPIQFTSVSDNLTGTKSLLDNAEWGGLIILGRATNNLLLADGELAVADGVGAIEGFDPSDNRVRYGDSPANFNDDDNSGILRYVSIRHGGSVVGDPELGNDINGLTLGSVGRGTTIEHVEIVANFDDGIEFFGGTVDMKYASVIFSGDDSFDYDQGYSGRNQFLFALQFAEGPFDIGDEGFEADGDDEDSGNEPLSSPTIYNATIIGNASDRGVLAKEAFKGRISNSIFGNFSVGVDLDNARTDDALANFNAGTLVFSNNSFVGVPTLLTVGGAAPAASVLNQFTSAGNISAPGLIDVAFDIDVTNGTAVTDGLSFVPAAGSASSTENAPLDDFFSSAMYRGAFAPGTDNVWLSSYSIVDAFDFDNSLVSCPSDINGDGTINSSDFVQFIGDFGSACGN